MSDPKPYEIRAGLLHLARDIIAENAHMTFEQQKTQQTTAKEWSKYTTEQVIAEAEKLYAFVSKK
jgi:hypothetical protein